MGKLRLFTCCLIWMKFGLRLDLILILFFICCGYPSNWVRQQAANTSNTKSPGGFVLWIDATKAASIHVSLHMIWPCLSWSPLRFWTWNFHISDRLDTGLKDCDWSNKLTNVDDFWNYSTREMRKHIPVLRGREWFRKPWMNKSTAEAIDKKRREWVKYQNCRSDDNFGSYKKTQG